MPKDHSFDIVSKVNLQEVHNGLQQAQKEIATRFDFRGTSASIVFDEATTTLKITADHRMQIQNVRDVTETKLAKRHVPLQALVWQEPEQLPGGTMKQESTLVQGIASDKARQIVKWIKDLGLKKVQPRIDGDSVRVTSRQLDDLQAVMQQLRQHDFGIPIQCENYR